MAANDNLSNELFFTAYRGLNGPLDRTRGLGMHWSANDYKAEAITEHQRSGDERFYEPSHTTLISAHIPMSSVETNTKTLRQASVYSPEDLSKNSEEEIPVKKGSPVFVRGITTIKSESPYDYFTGQKKEEVKERIRSRTYNPPRKMQA